MQKLNGNDLKINQPAKWDCYDTAGALLLRKGSVIASQRQLDALLEQGLLTDPQAAPTAAYPSPFRRMTDIQLRLRMLYSNLTTARATDFPNQVLKISRDLQSVCEFDADAALGILFLGDDGRYTITHPLHVAILCELAAKHLEIAAGSRLYIVAAALTSNIAMIELQNTLQKQQSPLTGEQSEKIQLHPLQAVDMLRQAGVKDEIWINAVLHHHERLDGKGYPGALRGDQISLPARILSLADTYSAMISPRNYRVVKFAREALRTTFLKRGAEMDESLAHLFVNELGVFPPGAFVTLQNEEVAIVVRRGTNAMEPQVKSVLSSKGVPLAAPILRDSGQDTYAIREMIPPSKGFVINRQLLWDYAE